MAQVSKGCLIAGNQATVEPIVIPAGDTAQIVHDAGQKALYILLTDAANGGLIDSSFGLVVNNNHNSTNITNTSGSTVGLYAYIYFEIFSPGKSGFIPAADVIITP